MTRTYPTQAKSALGSYCDTVPLCVTAIKRERLVNNLQNLSVSDRVRMLRAMPLSVAEKKELRSGLCSLLS